MSESLNKSLDELITENQKGPKKYFNKPISIQQRNFQKPQYFGGSGVRERPNYRPHYENPSYRPPKQQHYYEDNEKEDDREDNHHISQKIIHKQIRKTTGPRKQIFTKKFQSQQQFTTNNNNNNNNNFSEEEYEEDIEQERQQQQQQQQQIQQSQKQYPRKHESSREHKKRLKIQNLNKKIDNNELRELCSTHGKLVKCGIVWDDLGYSTGVAIVEFEREEEAKRALNDYNDAELDGEVLKVTYCERD